MKNKGLICVACGGRMQDFDDWKWMTCECGMIICTVGTKMVEVGMEEDIRGYRMKESDNQWTWAPKWTMMVMGDL